MGILREEVAGVRNRVKAAGRLREGYITFLPPLPFSAGHKNEWVPSLCHSARPAFLLLSLNRCCSSLLRVRLLFFLQLLFSFLRYFLLAVLLSFIFLHLSAEPGLVLDWRDKKCRWSMLGNSKYTCLGVSVPRGVLGRQRNLLKDARTGGHICNLSTAMWSPSKDARLWFRN